MINKNYKLKRVLSSHFKVGNNYFKYDFLRLRFKIITFSRACLTFFSDSTLLCNLKMQMYSFPAPCWDFAKRVVLSMQTIKQPDT